MAGGGGLLIQLRKGGRTRCGVVGADGTRTLRSVQWNISRNRMKQARSQMRGLAAYAMRQYLRAAVDSSREKAERVSVVIRETQLGAVVKAAKHDGVELQSAACVWFPRFYRAVQLSGPSSAGILALPLPSVTSVARQQVWLSTHLQWGCHFADEIECCKSSLVFAVARGKIRW